LLKLGFVRDTHSIFSTKHNFVGEKKMGSKHVL